MAGKVTRAFSHSKESRMWKWYWEVRRKRIQITTDEQWQLWRDHNNAFYRTEYSLEKTWEKVLEAILIRLTKKYDDTTRES